VTTALLVVSVALAVAGAPQSVEIVVIGTPADLQRVRDLTDPGRLGGAPPRWARADRFDPRDVLRPGAALRCWVDLSRPARARLTFAAGTPAGGGTRAGDRFLVRDVELSGRFDELDRQALAQVLELSVAALLEDERAGLSRAEAQALLLPEEPVVETAALPSPSIRSRLYPGVFYAAQAQGGGLPIAHGPGLSLDWVGRGRPLGAFGWLEGQVRLPEQAREQNIGVDLFTLAARAGLGVGWNIPPSATARARALRAERLAARVGVGIEFARVSPRPGTTDGAVVVGPQRWSESVVLSAALGLRLAVGRRLGVELRALGDLLPTAVHYDLATPTDVRPVFSPRRWRPGLALGVTL
jgi:hypothetical protein